MSSIDDPTLPTSTSFAGTRGGSDRDALAARRAARANRRAGRSGDDAAGRDSGFGPEDHLAIAAAAAAAAATGAGPGSGAAATGAAMGTAAGRSELPARLTPTEVPVPVPSVVEPVAGPARSMADNGLVHTATAWVDRLAAFKPPKLDLRPRLLPSVVFVAVLMIGIRSGEILTELRSPSVGAGQPVLAQTVTPEVGAENGAGAAQLAQAPAPAEDAGAGAVAAPDPILPTAGPATGTATGAAADTAPAPRRQVAEGGRVSEDDLVRELAERRRALDERERALDEREALLAAAEGRIEEKLAEMETLRGQIEDMLGVMDDARQEQLGSLVRIYESMRPGDAADIFDGLDQEVLINVLEQMREQKAAAILANMNPGRAREVTRELATRRQLPDMLN